MPARPPLATTRRTALGGALLGLGAVAGCNLDPPSKEPAGVRAPTGADPDTALVADVLAELTELGGLVSAVGTKYPRLAPRLAGLGALHEAHRRALGDDAAQDPDPGALPAGVDAFGLVSGRERRAQHLLADWSVRAESGALARLLASMSAGLAQQLVLLSSAAPQPEAPA